MLQDDQEQTPRFKAALAAGGAVHMVVFGTSLSSEKSAFWRRHGGDWVAEIRKMIGRDFPGRFRLTNRSKWGSDSRWAARQIGRRVLELNPDVVLIEFAINDADVRNTISIRESRENLMRMIGRIREATPNCEIVPMTMNPVFGRHVTLRPRLADYYDVYRDVARIEGLCLLDFHTRWVALAATRANLADRIVDGIHPDSEFCRRFIVREFFQILQWDSSLNRSAPR